MSSPFRSSALRGLCLVLLATLVLTAFIAPCQAEPPVTSTRACTPLFAGLTDYIIGNRSRMVQTTFIAFGLGILILVTATRKH